eukprot:COSAG02_NODE_21805_length_774_cov_1.441481_1_plen_26_part_10
MAIGAIPNGFEFYALEKPSLISLICC